MNELPSISIIIPTLNSEKTLKDCLGSIAMQDYPKDKIEVIVADGGLTDGTLEIISEFSVASNLQPQPSNIHIVPNNLKTGEAGKAVGLKNARNDIIAFVDSDNILPDKDWLKRMVEPFNDPEIIASEPIEYTYRATDGYITRYCALLGDLFQSKNVDIYCSVLSKKEVLSKVGPSDSERKIITKPVVMYGRGDLKAL
jgi:glycosyltransferase involved in cell wall biosynthesis